MDAVSSLVQEEIDAAAKKGPSHDPEADLIAQPRPNAGPDGIDRMVDAVKKEATPLNGLRLYAILVTFMLIAAWRDRHPRAINTKLLAEQIASIEHGRMGEEVEYVNAAAQCQISNATDWIRLTKDLLGVNAETPWVELPQIKALTPALREGNMWNHHSSASCGHFSCVTSTTTEWTQAPTKPLGHAKKSTSCAVSAEAMAEAKKAEHQAKHPKEYCRKFILSFTGMGSMWMQDVSRNAHIRGVMGVDPIYSLPNSSPESFLHILEGMRKDVPRNSSCRGDRFRAVLVVRDPRDSLIDIRRNNLLTEDAWAQVSYQRLLQNCGEGRGLLWEMDRLLPAWSNICQFMNWRHPDIRVVHYEALKEEPQKTWERVALHLYPEVVQGAEEDVTNAAVTAFVRAASSKKHEHRPKTDLDSDGEVLKGAWSTTFDKPHRDRFHHLYQYLLEKLGYEHTSEWRGLWMEAEPHPEKSDKISLRVEDMPNLAEVKTELSRPQMPEELKGAGAGGEDKEPKKGWWG